MENEIMIKMYYVLNVFKVARCFYSICEIYSSFDLQQHKQKPKPDKYYLSNNNA